MLPGVSGGSGESYWAFPEGLEGASGRFRRVWRVFPEGPEGVSGRFRRVWRVFPRCFKGLNRFKVSVWTLMREEASIYRLTFPFGASLQAFKVRNYR